VHSEHRRQGSDMEATGFQIGAVMARSALIAEPVLPEALVLMAAVSSLGFRVTTADNFHAAVERLRTPPDLLIADIRLGEFNGLHLVLRGKSARPELAALVVSTADDPVLRLDAEQLGATFVLRGTTVTELRAAICRTWRRTPGTEGPIRSPFERRRGERRQESAPMAIDRRRAERRRDIHQSVAPASARA
jgi:DNA-binding response OmpR family regulator